jgi:hypothetical protein
MKIPRNPATAMALLLAALVLVACNRAPNETLATNTLTVQLFQDAEHPNGEGVCELDANDTPAQFDVSLSAISADGIEAEVESTTLTWATKTNPRLPITITATLPQNSPNELGLVDTLVITSAASPPPAFVVNTFNNGACKSRRDFAARLANIGRDTRDSSSSMRATLVALLSVPLGLIGLLYLIKSDWAWDWHVATERFRGVVHLERTDEWETSRILTGSFALLLALLATLFAFSF